MKLIKKIELMKRYKETYESSQGMRNGLREMKCLQVLFPAVFVKPHKDDFFVGRCLQLPFGMELFKLAGTHLDYSPLLKLGLEGMKQDIYRKTVEDQLVDILTDEEEDFYHSRLIGISLIQTSITHYYIVVTEGEHPEKELMAKSLESINSTTV